MTWKLVAYIIALLLSTGICGTVALLLWHRRRTSAGFPLILLLSAAAIWSLAVALEAMATYIPTKVFWSQVEYLGAATGGTFFLIFASQYTHTDRWLTRRAILFLSIVPIATLLIVATNEWHHWIWDSFTLDSSSGDAILIYGHAAWFYVTAFYNYALIFLGMLLLGRFLIRSPGLYRMQTAAIVIGALAPAVSSAVYVFGLGPIRGLDTSPLAFGVTGIVLAWGVFRYQLLDLVPIARDMLLEQLKDGVVVLDNTSRVVDVNPAAKEMLGDSRVSVGQKLELKTRAWAPPLTGHQIRPELALGQDPPRHLEVGTVPLYDQHEHQIGRLVILYDVTEQKKMQTALEKMNNTLERTVAGRTEQLEAAVAELQNEIAERKRVEETLRGMEDVLAQRVADQSHKLSALYELILFAGQAQTVEEIQEQALATIMSVMSSDAGCIHQWDEKLQTLRLVAQRGLAPEMQSQVDSLPSNWLFPDRAPRAIPDLPTSTDVPAAIRLPGFRAYLGIPTLLLGRPIGSLSIYWKQSHSFPVEDISLFSAMSDQLGIIIENVRLRQRGEAAAALQERRRLARDLHDSVTQSLHSLVMNADTASHRLKQHKLERTESSLAQLGESARQALKEMRLLLYELRLASLDQVNLVDALQLRLDAVEKRAGIEVKWIAENAPRIPKPWEGELYCIAMEALNNSLKHARAKHVTVRIVGYPNGVDFEIADDGRGIDPLTKRPGGMGLHNMAERAERLGGKLKIDSTPNAGTRVHLCIGDHK